MSSYIATFYSHFGAIRFRKQCQGLALEARVMPVPRDLSSSCGSCVQFSGSLEAPAALATEETEQVVQITDKGYVCLWRAKEG